MVSWLSHPYNGILLRWCLYIESAHFQFFLTSGTCFLLFYQDTSSEIILNTFSLFEKILTNVITHSCFHFKRNPAKVSNHWQTSPLFNSLFRITTNKTPHYWASNANHNEPVMCWHHHHNVLTCVSMLWLWWMFIMHPLQVSASAEPGKRVSNLSSIAPGTCQNGGKWYSGTCFNTKHIMTGKGSHYKHKLDCLITI